MLYSSVTANELTEANLLLFKFLILSHLIIILHDISVDYETLRRWKRFNSGIYALFLKMYICILQGLKL